MPKSTVAKATSIPKAKPMYLAAWDHQPLLSRIWVTRKTKDTLFTLGKFQHLIGASQTAEVELIPANLDGVFVTASLDKALTWLTEQAQAESERLERAQRQMVYQTIDLSSLCLNVRRYPQNAAIYLRGYTAKFQQRKDKDHAQD